MVFTHLSANCVILGIYLSFEAKKTDKMLWTRQERTTYSLYICYINIHLEESPRYIYIFIKQHTCSIIYSIETHNWRCIIPAKYGEMKISFKSHLKKLRTLHNVFVRWKEPMIQGDKVKQVRTLPGFTNFHFLKLHFY